MADQTEQVTQAQPTSAPTTPVQNKETTTTSTEQRSSRPTQRSTPQHRQRQGTGNYRGGGYQRNNRFNNNRRSSSFFQPRRKVCPVRIEEIDWKKVDSLRYFIGERGGIRPRRKTGANAKLQRKAAQAIKRARHMALLPFTGEHIRLMRNQRD